MNWIFDPVLAFLGFIFKILGLMGFALAMIFVAEMVIAFYLGTFNDDYDEEDD